MCSIIGSFDTKTAKELCKINNYRGALSHSITYIDSCYNVQYMVRNKGEINLDEINIPKDYYCIIHQQAPTQQSEFIHPAQADYRLLWHNGILKPETINRIQKEIGCNDIWDTFLLLRHLNKNRIPLNIDGSFACLYLDNYQQLYAFRNELVPLFYDEKMNISSTKYNDMIEFKPNVFYDIDLSYREISKIENLKFQTVNNPYYFGE